jgi:hypothetical protein
MNCQEFDNILSPYARAKEKRADEQLNFYTERVNSKRRFAQWSGAVVLVISLTIPIITNLDLKVPQHLLNLIITSMSLLIALVSGLEGLHQWRTTWKEYSKSIVQIKTLIGLWEIKVAKARRLTNHDDIAKELSEATEKLLSEVEKVTFAEMGAFFAARLDNQHQDKGTPKKKS